MILKEIGKKLKKLGAYKYSFLILALGVGLLLLPVKEKGIDPPKQEMEQEDLEARLAAILSQVEGAGCVDVMLTYSEDRMYEYQTNRKTVTDEHGTEEETETVLLSGTGAESPVIVRSVYPICRGAVVLCQGADSPSVRLRIIDAVSSVTGLSSDKISVIKMKNQQEE